MSDSTLRVYVVWSSQQGAAERHVPGATRLMAEPRVRHYWDENLVVGRAFQPVVGSSIPAWDTYLLFDRDAVWTGETMPVPAWWEHQLNGMPPDRALDPKRFANKAMSLIGEDRLRDQRFAEPKSR